MEPEYFAKVDNGSVVDLRKTTEEYMLQNPDLYLGEWVKVTDKYPAIGWSWSIDTGFVEPIYME